MITIGTFLFTFSKVLDFGVINLLNNQFAVQRARLFFQMFDFVSLGIILVVCWPRKEWPPFFTLAVNELFDQNGNLRQGGGRNLDPATSMTSYITEKLLCGPTDDAEDPEIADSKKSEAWVQIDRTFQLGTKDAVLFINPTKYSLDLDDSFEESEANQEFSSFDPNAIVEEESEKKMGSLKEAQEGILSGRDPIDQYAVKAVLVFGFAD